MLVEFALCYIGSEEIVELPDDFTEEEISEEYDAWLLEQGGGWRYYEEEEEELD